MTAINIIRQRDRVHVVTDAACWDSEGIVVGFWPKAFSLPHMPAVIATRGAYVAPVLLGWEFARFATFDDLVSGIEDAMPVIHEQVAPTLEQCGVVDLDIVIAGWSAARSRPESYLMRTTTDVYGISPEEAEQASRAGGYRPEAYHLVELEPVTFAPMSTNEQREAAGFDEWLEERDEETMRRELVTLLEVERRLLASWSVDGGGVQFHQVGGWATITTVTATGVGQSVFHRWPEDKVGERITPSPIDWQQWRDAHKPKQAVPPMNRQQRRYLERQARKKMA